MPIRKITIEGNLSGRHTVATVTSRRELRETLREADSVENVRFMNEKWARVSADEAREHLPEDAPTEAYTHR